MVTPRGTPTLIEEAQRFRDALLRRDSRMLAELIRAYQPVMASLERSIQSVADLIARRAAAGIAQTPGSVVRLFEFRAMLAQATVQLERYSGQATTLIASEERLRIERAIRDARALANAGLPGGLRVADLERLGIEWAVVDAQALEVQVGLLRDGSTLRNYLSTQVVGDTISRVSTTLTAGILDNPRVTARRLRTAMQGGLPQALRVARTETLRAYREATRAQFAANPRLIRGYRRMEALDDRTCPGCWMMDGTLYATDTTMDEHVQGRGYLVPEMVSPRELGLPLDPLPQPVPGRQQFRALSRARQRKIIGNDKLFKAWQSGRIGDEGLVGRRLDPTWGASTGQNSAVRALRGDHLPRLPDPDEFYDPGG